MADSTARRPGLLARWGAFVYDPFLALGERRGMAARRRALLAGTDGEVLEIGAGTGLNLPHYPDAVSRLVLTEPDAGMLRRLERRVTRSGRAATVVGAGAEELPFPEASFDCVVSTMVLCTVPDPVRALGELRRVLRPGGRLVLVEHVRSDDARLARRQDRWARPWAGFAAGCRCNQPTLELLTGAGLDVRGLEHGRWRGMPSIVGPLVAGAARVAA